MPLAAQYAVKSSRARRISVCIIAILCLAIASCSEKKPKPQPIYSTLPPKKVPAFLKDTVLQRTDLHNVEPLQVSGYGLVKLPEPTADNSLIPTPVRQYMIKEMVKRGFGSTLQPGFENITPEEVLRDPHFAVVRVDAFLPPGVRKYDSFDVQVSTLEGTNTTSIARGTLFRAELKKNGANPIDPLYSIDIPAIAEGPIFVNPAYSLQSNPSSPSARSSLRVGLVMNGGRSLDYRPMILRLRQPQRSLSRGIELLIEQRFGSLRAEPTEKIAAAKDEGVIFIKIPQKFRGDWQHFAGVVQHLYFDTSPEFATLKAKQLAQEAVKPNAPLEDISYCWEGLGPGALPFVTPLMTNASPEVAYAATRAAAYLDDPGAQQALMAIATSKNHPFQLNAVRVLGDLPSSPVNNQLLRRLLDAEESLVRIEAYRVLVEHHDPSIYSTKIGARTDGDNPKFTLDTVPSQGPPLIYASRMGEPRIAIIGPKPSLNLPVVFTTMDNQFMISSNPDGKTVQLFYRGPELRRPLNIPSAPDVAEVVARLGGVGTPGQPTLNFGYAEIVALLQGLSDGQKLAANVRDTRLPAAFVLQDVPQLQDALDSAPPIPETGRPTGAEQASSIPPRTAEAKPGAALSGSR